MSTVRGNRVSLQHSYEGPKVQRPPPLLCTMTVRFIPTRLSQLPVLVHMSDRRSAVFVQLIE